METFNRDEHKEFSPIWRGRSHEESVGVFNDDGDLLGFILIFENQRCLKYIAVHPRFQAHGLGSLLLKHALTRCLERGVSLNLVPANATVQAWYERQGFVISSWFKEKDGKTYPCMNFHTYGTRRHLKNLKRLHDSIQNGAAETGTARQYGGGPNAADRAAGTSKSLYHHQNLAGFKQGGKQPQGAGAREDQAHEGS